MFWQQNRCPNQLIMKPLRNLCPNSKLKTRNFNAPVADSSDTSTRSQASAGLGDTLRCNLLCHLAKTRPPPSLRKMETSGLCMVCGKIWIGGVSLAPPTPEGEYIR